MRSHPAYSLPSVLLLLALLPASGCGPRGTTEGGADVKVDLTLQPEPPKVGTETAVVTLADKAGRPVREAAVKLEGNMNHAGMTPVFADARETEPGKYEAALEFTMGGDWFVLVNVTLADGRRLSRKVDVRGVKRGE
jgi:hypothetical protein